MSSKRVDYQGWDATFMTLANDIAKRSKDPNTQVGACIVDENNKIVSLGYNGFPNGCNDDHFPWEREGSSPISTKYNYVVHAELNSILNAKRDLSNCKIFVSMFPCAECAKAIIQSGIKEIIFVVDKYETTDSVISSKLMLFGANVKLFNLTTVNGECSKNFYTIKNFLSNKEVFNKVKKSEVYVSDNFQSVLKDLEIFNRQ